VRPAARLGAAPRPVPGRLRGHTQRACCPPSLSTRSAPTPHPGDLVIDPLAGVGTTLVEATHLGRDAIGIEYEPGWAALAAANLRHATGQGATGRGFVVAGDATRLPDLLPSRLWRQAAMVLASPPYGRTIHGRVEHRRGPLLRFADQYGGRDQASLTHRGLGGIRDGLATILAGCLPLLRPGGVVAVTARPWRRAGLLVDLPGAIVDAALAAGLAPTERCVALLAAARDSRLLPRHSFWQLASLRKARARGQPLLPIAHEDVLVFRRVRSHAMAKPQRAEERGMLRHAIPHLRPWLRDQHRQATTKAAVRSAPGRALYSRRRLPCRPGCDCRDWPGSVRMGLPPHIADEIRAWHLAETGDV